MTRPANTPPEEEQRKPRWPQPQWYWMTRAIGATMVLYGMFFDHTPERGTLIITGTGLIGVDKVLPPRNGGSPPDPPAAA